MKPKLIILNGPPSIGKSTLAQRYVDEHPMALNLDIDRIWFMMGQWQASRPRSSEQKMKLAYAMADLHLKDGFDVIVAQDLDSLNQHEEFEAIAHQNNAEFYEILLTTPFKNLLDRFIARGKASGYATGWRPGGIMDTEGREAKLKQMQVHTLTITKQRLSTIVIESLEGQPEHTYAEILRVVSANPDM